MGFLSNLPFRKRSQPEPATSAEPVAALPEVPARASAAEPVREAPAATSAASVLARAQAEELVHRVAQELPAFLAVAVAEAATGTILAGQWAGYSGGKAAEAALAHAALVRQAQLAIEALQLSATEQLADILITLHQQLHLLRVLPRQGWLLYLAVRTQDTNLALARSVLQAVDNK